MGLVVFAGLISILFLMEMLVNDRTAERARNLLVVNEAIAHFDALQDALVEQRPRMVGRLMGRLDHLSEMSTDIPASAEVIAQLWRDVRGKLGKQLQKGADSVLSSTVADLRRIRATLSEHQASLADDFAASAWYGGVLGILGIGIATAFCGIVILNFLVKFGEQDQEVTLAKEETAHILETVNAGLFLLDKNGVLGSEISAATQLLFRTESFENRKLEDLLRPIVADRTLKTAIDFVALLWGNRVNENLIRDLNPLSEVEVHFSSAGGGFDNRFLAFDFSRVSIDGVPSKILVTVTDITERVVLAKELEESRAESQVQIDLFVGLLHVDPVLLTSFLNDSDVAMEQVNQTLKKPARDEAAFRSKLDDIFRQVHKVKGEAAALGLSTIEDKAHSFEDALQRLRERANLTGNDFLPLALKLDDLLSHLASVRELIDRLADLHSAIADTEADRDLQPSTTASYPQVQANSTKALAAEQSSVCTDTSDEVAAKSGTGTVPDAFDEEPSRRGASRVPDELDADYAKQSSGPPPDESTRMGLGLSATLLSLVQRIAEHQGKSVVLKMQGIESIPQAYQGVLKDIAIQFVRNAVVHGLETPIERRTIGKPLTGEIHLTFQPNEDGYCCLQCRDDGRGIDAMSVRMAAIEKQLVDYEQAYSLSDKQAVGLIFRPGLSTQEDIDEDAGRGVGMDFVRETVAQLEGRIKMSTRPGQTRFKVLLPLAAIKKAA